MPEALAQLPRILVAAHAFPETGGSRIDRFVKLLPRTGLEPVVLAAAECATPEARRLLAQDYPANLEVHWARSFAAAPFTPRYLVRGADARFYRLLSVLSAPERFLLFPDYMVRWIPTALLIARRLAKAASIHCVVTSSPPESTHLIGYYLRRVWAIPWLADFRDLWTEKGLLCRPPTRLHAAAIRRLEHLLFTAPDHVIANTPENRELHIERFRLNPDHVTLIPNGFDREDLGTHQTEGAGRDGIYRIGYMGHFDKHGFPWRVFLLALKRFAQEAPPGSIRLVHCGFQSAEVRRFVRSHDLTAVVEWRGSMSHKVAVQTMARTDLLLSLLYDNEYSDAIVNAKLYHYLMLHRPILAIGPVHGAMARIIRQTGTGKVVPASEGPEPILATLRGYHRAWATGIQAFTPNEAQIARYDSICHTEALASIVRHYARPASATVEDSVTPVRTT